MDNYISLELIRNKNQELLKRCLSFVLALSMLATQIVPAHAQSLEIFDAPEIENEVETSFDLVVLVVDENLRRDDNSYLGLRNEFQGQLSAKTIRERVFRYAQDIRDNNELTDVKVVFFDSETESVLDIAGALENFYRNGDGDNNRLVGTVLVGDIPLPVVNKNGNRFVSVFPYTDFSDPVYVYDPEIDSFEMNAAVEFPQPEIWHGVIRADSAADLAEYFDKNHLYYEGEPEFANFEKKLFFADFIHEEEMINEDVYRYYLEYLESAEDLAYQRYNKFWANELNASLTGELPVNEDSELGRDFAENLDLDNALANVPDIYTKDVIDSMLIPYYQIFTRYISNVNDWADATGRYTTRDVDSVPKLITMKDEFTKVYLRNVNDAIEKKVNAIVDEIQEPLPLVEYSELRGRFEEEDGDVNFQVGFSGNDLPLPLINAVSGHVTIRNNYYNEALDQMFINGVAADEIDSARQCSVYLGSTRDEYFDENLDFNPAAVDGEYSVLTRALRSDNPGTARAEHTVGVNTRMIGPEEAFGAAGVAAVGALVEANVDYGVPAFYVNPQNNNYVNPLAEVLQEGDLIVSVNGESLAADFTFEQAIEKSYSEVGRLIDLVNDGDDLSEYPYRFEIPVNQSVFGSNASWAAGNFSIEFVRDGREIVENFTFSVHDDGLTGNNSPQGNPNLFVLLSEVGFEDIDFTDEEQFDFNQRSNGAIFTLYDTRDAGGLHNGFANNGYDLSAGCSANNAGRNSDRCFAPLALMPVLDPAGAVAPVKTVRPGEQARLEFPENVKRDDSGNNSNLLDDHRQHFDSFPYPESYSFEEVDEVHYDACYFGLPTVDSFDFDSNPYAFPLDQRTEEILEDFIIDQDWYGRLLDAFGTFVQGRGGTDVEISPTRERVWLNLDELGADDIVVNNSNRGVVLLSDFSDVYGIFDGIDNDGDGIRDYEWRDLDEDGVAETKFVDFDEAAPEFGIARENLEEINRKMLSQRSTYRVPAPLNQFDVDIVLEVEPTLYRDTEISSKILHNEPTEHTIARQVQSLGALSLPIDDPRYVAFKSEPTTLPIYPEPAPIDEDIDLAEILSQLPDEEYRYPGKTEKILYPNLFQLNNYLQLESELRSLADDISLVPGAYRLIGEQARLPEDASEADRVNQRLAIRDEVLEEYLMPVVTGLIDDPVSGFDLTTASNAKIVDALEWQSLSIDDKHEYVLNKYLDPSENAFINDNSLFPAPFGFEAKSGYEAAYLVLDGEGDFFDLNFNKDLPDESDRRFDPLSVENREELREREQQLEEEIAQEQGRQQEEQRPEYVALDQFLNEVNAFIDGFTTVPEFHDACGYLSNLESGQIGALRALTAFELEVDRDALQANGADTVEVTLRGLDEEGELAIGANELVTLNVSNEDVLNPADSLTKSLVNGMAVFTLRSAEEGGSVNLFVENGDGLSSNVERVETIDASLQIASTVDDIARSEMVADGESVMRIEVAILDGDGALEIDKRHTVRFETDSDLVTFDGGNLVESEGGVAALDLKAGTVTGEFTIRAEVVNGPYPIAEKELRLVAGEPVAMELRSETYDLVANGESETEVELILRDEFGNLADNSFYPVSLFVEGAAVLDESADIDRDLVGLQLATVDGRASATLVAGDEAGEISVMAFVMNSDDFVDQFEDADFEGMVGTTRRFEIFEEVELDLSFDVDEMVADGRDIARLGVQLQSDGVLLTDYNGPINFRILNAGFGEFVRDVPEYMTNGFLNRENVLFGSSTSAGRAEILVEVPGFASEVISIETVADEPYQIVLSAEDRPIYTSSDESLVLSAEVQDKYGNRVMRDSDTVVRFGTTEATSEFVRFTGDVNVRVASGVAQTTLRGGQRSGTVNIVAEAEGIFEDTISREVVKHVTSDRVAGFNPRALYVSLLGGAFGEVGEENLSEVLLNSGQVQAVASVTATADDVKKLISIDGSGKIGLVLDTIAAEVVPATDSFPYQKVVFRDLVNDAELGNSFVVPDADAELFLGQEVAATGIYVNRVSERDEAIAFVEEDQEVLIKKGPQVLASVDEFGRIRINEESLSLGLKEGGQHFGFEIVDRGEVLAEIAFVQTLPVRELAFDQELNLFFPGVYVQMANSDSRYDFVPSFTGIATNEEKGMYLVDTESEIDINQAAGSPFASLEDAGSNFGLGFEGDNKHMLLFSAGNTVGQSHLPYASEAGIIYGDPLVKLEVLEENISELSGFSRDIGDQFFAGNGEILDLIEYNYNNDGYGDLLAVYESGLIRLFEGEVSNDGFRDRGYILNIYGGILSATGVDVNNDGFEDLVVGTKESCRPGEVCLTQVLNVNGEFTRSTLNFEDLNGKAVSLQSEDMNLDGCSDLVLGDSSGNVRVYLNEQCEGFGARAQFVESFGIEIDSDVNNASSLFVNYDGASGESSLDFVLPDGRAEFVSISEAGFGASVKQTVDVNGEVVELGDRIDYIVTLRNGTGRTLTGVKLSDLTPPAMSVDLASLECLSQGCADDLQFVPSGLTSRSHVIEGISMPAGGEKVIKYTMIVEDLPQITLEVGHDFASYPSNRGDELPDIFVRPEFNPDRTLTYLYSVGASATDVNYERMVVLPGEEGEEDLLAAQFEEYGLPDLDELVRAAESGEPSDDLVSQVQGLVQGQHQDSDFNGCIDSWSDVNQEYEDTAEAIAEGIENLTSALRCSGAGCLPIPYNYAFLAPDGIVPGPGTPGFAAISVVDFPPYVLPTPSTVPSSFRFYVSPTLTGSVGFAPCFGTSIGHQAPCFATATSLIPQSVCNTLLAPVNDAIADANEFVQDTDLGLATIVSDGGQASTGTDAIAVDDSFSDPDSPFSYAASANIRIPGVPSVLTDWVDNQTDEIYNKLLDFPDFYFIKPDVGSFISDHASALGNFGDIQNVHDFVRAVNSLPIVNIEGREIPLRVPAISEQELERYRRQAELWIKHHEAEIEKIRQFWSCDINSDRRTLCDRLTVDLTELTRSVKQLMEQLDRLANLPQEIITWRNLEAKYAVQLICYLDAIINYTGGYIKRQDRIIQSWLKATEDVVRTFRDWRVLLDLMVEYQVSCDHCKSDRFSDLGLLLSLFVAVPDLPVVPLPKWPDVVFDASQVRTGIDIVWPDLVFKPEPINLPDLPTVTLPEFLPEYEIEIPGFEVPDWLDFPTLILPDLPDLPPLPLPQLPDLPRPPEIPDLPNVIGDVAANLKPVFAVLCLLKKGLIPVPEWGLATEIETLTQPNVQVVLPLIKSLSVQLPAIEYDFVREIRIEAKTDFGISTDFIYVVVKAAADGLNEKVEKLVEDINEDLDIPLQEIINEALDKAAKKAQEEIDRGVRGVQRETQPVSDELDEVSAFTEELREQVIADPRYQEVQNGIQQAHDVLSEYVASLDQYDHPDTYYLTAHTEWLDQSHPLLNRSLAEVQIDINGQELPNDPAIQQMVAVRDSLIDYVNGIYDSNSLIDDLEDFGDLSRILVEHDSEVQRFAQVASDVSVESYTGGQEKISFLGEGVEQDVYFDVVNGTERFIAANIELNAREARQTAASNGATAPAGVFVIAGGESENILAYDDELAGGVKMVFIDKEKDGDKDLVLAMGGSLYLKENHTEERSLRRGRILQGLFSQSVSDFTDEARGVSGLRDGGIGFNSVDLYWGATAGADGYEIVVRDSLRADLDNGVATLVAVDELSDPANPSFELETGQGNYYVNVFAIVDGERSLISDDLLVSAQVCSDNDPPFPLVGTEVLRVPVFKTIEIDASGSFDTEGAVVEYFLEGAQGELWSDTNVLVDSDGDGVPFNDRTNPLFKIGPFDERDELGIHEFVLHVVDEAGNSSQQKIEVEVFVPEIVLDEADREIRGEIAPEFSEVPVSVMRRRLIERVVDGELKLAPRVEKIMTDSIGANDKYYTDQNGEYLVDDLNLEDMILVENAAGEVVAEINPRTGNVAVIDDRYRLVANPATPPNEGTNLQVVGPRNEVLVTVYFVADINTDVNLRENFALDAESAQGLIGVHINDVQEEGYRFERIPANDPVYPGGARLVEDSSSRNLALFDTAGNVILLDPRVEIVKKENNHVADEPMVLLVLVDDVLVGEVHIASLRGLREAIVVGPNDVPSSGVPTPQSGALYGQGNEDVFALNALKVAELLEIDPVHARSILEDNPEILSDPEALVARGDFVKTLIKMLCIVPRDAAYLPYEDDEAGGGFVDVPFGEEELEDVYPFIKEAALLGLVDGYFGERDSVSGLTPFKPEANINRAEAVKIILEALEFRGVIDLGDIGVGEPWYEPFMDAAQDLTPYMLEGSFLQNNFVITEEEAQSPEELVTFGELNEMVRRVLDIYSCFEIDSDGDGLSDFCEVRFGVDEPDEDDDGDGLENALECRIGLDPTDQDSDGGGTLDGVELEFGSDPLNPFDDPEDRDGDGLSDLAELLIHGTDPEDPDTDDGGVNDGREVAESTDPLLGEDDGDEVELFENEPGVYAVPAECNTCPCVSTLTHSADVLPGDTIFSLISNFAEDAIFAKSNEIRIK